MRREVPILDSIAERIEADGLAALTDAERYYWAIWWLESEVSNGSFDQYFRNSSGDLAQDALESLRAVGAAAMAAIFEEATHLLPNGEVPPDRQQRNQILDGFTPAQQQRLDELSDTFSDYPDDLASLIETYVQRHEDQFLGPKTLMEKWTARHAQGADTRPKGVSEWDLDAEAIKDAQFTERKCPICGQPAPDYRKTCKRCGYPMGRATKLEDRSP